MRSSSSRVSPTGRQISRRLQLEHLELGERNDADLRILERDRVDLVRARIDAAEADQLARHLKARDLLVALVRTHEGLEEAGADGEQRVGVVAGAKQRRAARDLALRDDEAMLDALELVARQSDRKADLAQVAARAPHLARGGVQRAEQGRAEAPMCRGHQGSVCGGRAPSFDERRRRPADVLICINRRPPRAA